MLRSNWFAPASSSERVKMPFLSVSKMANRSASEGVPALMCSLAISLVASFFATLLCSLFERYESHAPFKPPQTPSSCLDKAPLLSASNLSKRAPASA